MKIPNRNRQGDVGFNMTPMIDVVFLLIIFFLVSSHLAKQESQMPLPLPVAQSGQEPIDDATPRVTINVLENGGLVLAGRAVNPTELQRRLKFELEQGGQRLEVRIRSDRNVPYRLVEPVMVACAKSGVWNVKFSVVRDVGS